MSLVDIPSALRPLGRYQRPLGGYLPVCRLRIRHPALACFGGLVAWICSLPKSVGGDSSVRQALSRKPLIEKQWAAEKVFRQASEPTWHMQARMVVSGRVEALRQPDESSFTQAHSHEAVQISHFK